MAEILFGATTIGFAKFGVDSNVGYQRPAGRFGFVHHITRSTDLCLGQADLLSVGIVGDFNALQLGLCAQQDNAI
jgi:hypothetical protein